MSDLSICNEYCPFCGKPCINRELRLDGYIWCSDNHKWKSGSGIKQPLARIELKQLRTRAEAAEKEIEKRDAELRECVLERLRLEEENERLREMLKPKNVEEPDGYDPEPFI